MVAINAGLTMMLSYRVTSTGSYVSYTLTLGGSVYSFFYKSSEDIEYPTYVSCKQTSAEDMEVSEQI